MSATFDTHAFDRASARVLDDLNAQRSTLDAHPAQRSTLNASDSQPSAPSTQPLSLPGRVTAFFTYYKGHKLGPYFVRRWKENGKAKKEYVKPEDLQETQRVCERHQQEPNLRKARMLQVKNLTKNMSFLWHMRIRSRKGRIRIEDILHLNKIEEFGMNVSGAPFLRKRNLGFMAPFFAKLLRGGARAEVQTIKGPGQIEPERLLADASRNLSAPRTVHQVEG